MPDRRCCCLRDCWSVSDDFDRTNSTDVSDDWVELVGDWEIDTNRLQETGTSGAIIRYATANPRGSNGVISVVCKLVDGAGQCIYLGDDDMSDYVMGKVVYDLASDTLTLTVLTKQSDIPAVERSAELVNPGTSWVIGDPLYLKLCCSGESPDAMVSFFATMGTTSFSEWICSDGNEGPYAALGNVSSEEITFDDFQFWEHYWARRHPNCPSCICSCEGHCVGRDLTLTMINNSGCPDMDAIEITLYYIQLSVDTYYWQSDYTNICGWYGPPIGPPDGGWRFTLVCDNADPGSLIAGEMTLYLDGVDYLCVGTQELADPSYGYPFTPTSGSCYPLYLEYTWNQPETPGWGACPCCEGDGNVSFVITESES